MTLSKLNKVNKKKIERFVISERELIQNKTPLTSFSVAHLFYGVPFNFNKCFKELTTGNIIFYK